MSSVVFNKCSIASQAKRFGGDFYFIFPPPFLLCGHCIMIMIMCPVLIGLMHQDLAFIPAIVLLYDFV